MEERRMGHNFSRKSEDEFEAAEGATQETQMVHL